MASSAESGLAVQDVLHRRKHMDLDRWAWLATDEQPAAKPSQPAGTLL
jgi:hypothetical protein